MWHILDGMTTMPWTKRKSFALENLAGGFHRTYLLALLQAQALFPAGVEKAIFHGQSKTYYDTLLTLAEFGESAREALVNFVPNKSAVEYQNLLRTFDKKQRKNVLEKKQLDSQRLEDAEDEESIMKILQTDGSKAFAKKTSEICKSQSSTSRAETTRCPEH